MDQGSDFQLFSYNKVACRLNQKVFLVLVTQLRERGELSYIAKDLIIYCEIWPSGDENSFSYKSDSCEYILEAAVGKNKRKTAR